MSDKINDGGPAFPTKMPSLDPRECGFYTNEGMTLRDYFAGIALPVVCQDCGGTIESTAKELGIEIKEYSCEIHWPVVCAKRSYAYADAMLKARSK